MQVRRTALDRRQVARQPGHAAGTAAHEILDGAILQRMERDHRQAAARRQHALGSRAGRAFRARPSSSTTATAQGLEGARRWIIVLPWSDRTPHLQALRIAVNDELGELERGLPTCWRRAAMAVVSFHSLEDRAVKDFVRSRAGRVRARLPPVEVRPTYQRQAGRRPNRR